MFRKNKIHMVFKTAGFFSFNKISEVALAEAIKKKKKFPFLRFGLG